MRLKSHLIITLLLMLLFFALPVFAVEKSPSQQVGGSSAPQPAGPAVSSTPQPSMPAKVNGAPQPGAAPAPVVPVMQPAARASQVSLNFDDADVYTIIQTIFGEILKVNYVVDPRVKGRVTFRAIAPVPAENVLPLMEVILRLNGIGIVEDARPVPDRSHRRYCRRNLRRSVSAGTPEKITATGKALLQVVPIIPCPVLRSPQADHPFLPRHNAVLIDVPKSNQIIIVDTDANVKRMLKLIEIFDNDKLKQRKPQVFVYQVQNGKAKDIACPSAADFLERKGERSETAAPTAPDRPGADRRQRASRRLHRRTSAQPRFQRPAGDGDICLRLTKIICR